LNRIGLFLAVLVIVSGAIFAADGTEDVTNWNKTQNSAVAIVILLKML